MSEQSNEYVYVPDKVTVQLFKEYTITYRDIYGTKRTFKKRAIISKKETAIEGSSLSQWTNLRPDTFPTPTDSEFAVKLRFSGQQKNFLDASVQIIDTLSDCIQNKKAPSSELWDQINFVRSRLQNHAKGIEVVATK